MLELTSLVGLALGLAILWLSPHPSVAWRSGGVILVLLCLFSGLQPKLEHQPAAIRPISGLLPSRWAFEGLLLLQSQSTPAPTGAESDESVQIDPAEIYFPVATQQMGLTADVLALLLMLVGLSRRSRPGGRPALQELLEKKLAVLSSGVARAESRAPSSGGLG